jgi:hypothetical protein
MQQWHEELMPETAVMAGSKETFYEALRQTIRLEIVKHTIRSSKRIQKTSVKTLWRSHPLPK